MKKSGQPNTMLPLILIGIGVLLVIGVLVFVLTNQSSPTAPAAGSNSGQGIPYPEVQRVSLANAKDAFDGKQAVFIDVRDPDSYNAGHIPGSINVPYSMIESWDGKLEMTQWIITYCT